MTKKKLRRFAEMSWFDHVIQPSFPDYFNTNHPLKGNWHNQVFKNNHPITLELGCGKGEYTIGLARSYPGRNVIGIDIKGARIWRGAKGAIEEEMTNVRFLRIRIDFITSFFRAGEVSEIWITFPDPQPKKKDKRLTSPKFLNRYSQCLLPGSPVHLKTDNAALYHYTQLVAAYNKLQVDQSTVHLYQSDIKGAPTSIQTFYEKQFLAMGKPIHFLSFRINDTSILKDPPESHGGELF